MGAGSKDAKASGTAEATAAAAPTLTDPAKTRAEDREQRRAAALRANLIRRKTQTRARREHADPSAPAPPDGGKSS